MSYEASAHEVQMKILRHLLLSPNAGFAELQKQTDLTSDHVNFHIKKKKNLRTSESGSWRQSFLATAARAR